MLIVDDDEAIRLALRLVLDEQHNVLEAADGRAALQLLEDRRVDVMLLDLLLPKTAPPVIEQGVRQLARTIRERLREPGRSPFAGLTTAP